MIATIITAIMTPTAIQIELLPESESETIIADYNEIITEVFY